MSECRIHYDTGTKCWQVVDLSGGTATAERVIFDVPVTAHPNGYVTCTGILKADELRTLSSVNAAAKLVRIVREHDLPGYINDASMLEWCITRDSGLGKWVIFRPDMPEVMITTSNIDMDCHAISSDGVLHCRAEMLLNGRTNRLDSAIDPDSVRLRTLTVHNQTVVVEQISIRAIARVQ